jgi:transposase
MQIFCMRAQGFRTDRWRAHRSNVAIESLRRRQYSSAHFGLASRRWQSDRSIDVQGRISKAGEADARRALYEAASALLTRFKRKDKVKRWGLAMAKRAGDRKATVAVARKLATIMHAMWRGGTYYCGDPEPGASAGKAQAQRDDRQLLAAPA